MTDVPRATQHFQPDLFEVYGEHGLAIATGGNGLRAALPTEPEHAVTLAPAKR